MKIVNVKWVDSTSMNGWNQIDDVKKFFKEDPHVIDTFGALVCEEKNFIIIAQSFGQTTLGDLIKIPRAVVKRIRIIERVDIVLDIKYE